MTLSDEIVLRYSPISIPIIYGPTATGKTKLSLELSKKIKEKYGKDVEIISADSRQVYREMNIGTDKIGQDIRSQIIHHQIDIINPDETYTAGQWQADTYRIIDEIIWRDNIPMIVWGTGLYIDTIVFNFNMGICEPDWEFRADLERYVRGYGEIPRLGIGTIPDLVSGWQQWSYDPMMLWNLLNQVDPTEAAKHHPSSDRFIIRALEIYYKTGIPKSQLIMKQTPKHPLLLIGLEQDVTIGNTMIDRRLKQMIEQGLVAEVQWLLEKWYSRDLASMRTIDYKQTVQYIDGTYAYDAYMEALQISNHQLAKKQRTWFRRYNYISDDKNIQKLHFFIPDYT